MEQANVATTNIRSFAQAHRQSLYVVAALTLFVTFLVKDALHDYLKDSNDSITEAQDEYRRVRDLGW